MNTASNNKTHLRTVKKSTNDLSVRPRIQAAHLTPKQAVCSQNITLLLGAVSTVNANMAFEGLNFGCVRRIPPSGILHFGGKHLREAYFERAYFSGEYFGKDFMRVEFL